MTRGRHGKMCLFKRKYKRLSTGRSVWVKKYLKYGLVWIGENIFAAISVGMAQPMSPVLDYPYTRKTTQDLRMM